MAGAVRATFGSLTLILGILMLLAGLGAAGYGYLDEMQHEEDAGPLGVARDQDRSDLNQALMVGGGVGAVLGLVLLVVGIVVVSTGRTADRGAARGGSGGGPDGGPDGAPAARDAAARSPARVGVAVAVAGGLVVVLVVAVMLASGGVDGSGGLFSGDEEPRMLGDARMDGTVGATFTLLGGSQMPANSASGEPVPVPAGAVRAEVDVSWSTDGGGAQRLQVTVQVRDGDGWRDVADATGPSTLWINATLDGEPELRLRVFPGEDGAVAEQDYSARVRFWDQ